MARTTAKTESLGDSKAPVNIEIETPTEEPTPAKEAAKEEEIETDVRTRLSKRTDRNDPFVPSNPAEIEAKAKAIAEEKGFEMTRGTEIGARLMARARNRGF